MVTLSGAIRVRRKQLGNIWVTRGGTREIGYKANGLFWPCIPEELLRIKGTFPKVRTCLPNDLGEKEWVVLVAGHGVGRALKPQQTIARK